MRRHPLQPRTAGVVAALLLLTLLVAGTGVANAASLGLLGPSRPYATAVARCATGPATVTASGTPSGGRYPQVTVRGLSGTCTDARVVLATSTGTVLLDASAPVVGGTVTAVAATPFTPPAAGAARVYVAVGSWPVAASWVPPVSTSPVYPAPDGTAFDTAVTWDLKNATSGQQACFTIRVTTTSTTPIVWSAYVDTAQAPFNGARAGYSVQGSDGWKFQLTPDTPTPGIIRISGRTDVWQPYDTVVAGQVRVVEVCNYSLPGAAVTPSAYTVTTSQGAWNAQRACVVTTVTGNGTSPFYVGWQTPVDMTAAVQRIRSGGGTPGAWRYGGDEWKVERLAVPSLTGPFVFDVRSRTASNLLGTQSFTFETCVVDG